jgi:hypothetical protein
MKAYGVREPTYLSSAEIQKTADGLHIPGEQSFVLDKSFFKIIKGRDTATSLAGKCSPMISKYMQPLQLMYFNEKGNLISFHNNCYAGGFPKLKWNRDGQFDKFIPKTTIPVTDSVVNLQLLLPHLKPLVHSSTVPNSDLTIILFWSEFMGKQSKILVATANKNLKLDSSGNHKIIFVNTDNCFLDEDNSAEINKK